MFRNAQFVIGANWTGIPADWIDSGSGSGYYLVHFAERITPAMRSELEGLGVTVMSYVPHNAYIVRLEGSKVEAVSTVAKVDWVGLVQPYLKVDPALLFPDRTLLQTKVRVSLYPQEPFDNALAAIKTVGGEVLDQVEGLHRSRISFSIDTSRVPEATKALAYLREVYWVQLYPDYELCNDYTQYICQSGPYGSQATPLYDHGVFGAGQIVAVMDTGADADMCYFYDSTQGMIVPNATPNFNQRKVIAYIGPSEYVSGFDSNGHGTHTAGTIAGDNFLNPGVHNTGDGIALLAQLVIQDYGNSYDVYPPDDQYSAHQAAYDLGARVHSNSWGWPGYAGIYHDDCEEVDQFVWDNPGYNIVYAAGNDGSSSDTIRPPGTAKNVITVGATEGGAASPENNEYFSSHGPTDDGRRKPDVTMPGGDTISASNDSNPSSYNCTTTTMSGTSMATPGVAGAAALIRDYFNQGFYPLGVPDTNFIIEPSAALVKAVMINSGVNMTGTYTADSGSGHADLPSQGQGWGRVTLDGTLFFSGDEHLLWLEDNATGLNTGASSEYYISVIDSSEPLEITLVWSDYPSTPGASINLVNDLDLTVTGNSQTYLGNVYSGGQSTPGGSYDRINNVECVQIDAPAVGAYVVRIDGYNVPQGSQPFALVVTGALSFSDGVVSLNAAQYPCNAIATITVSDADLAGQGAQDVTIVSTIDPTGETLTLIETAASSGIFDGLVQLTTASPGVGEVQIAHDATVTATYIDADDGNGGINVPKTDSATVDCLAPVISNVVVTWYSSSGARISWQTNEPSSSRVEYGLVAPPTAYLTNSSLVTAHELEITGLTECSDYIFRVVSSDASGNTATDDNAGNYYDFTTYAVYTLLNEAMDADPEWTVSGGSWAWGQPTGGGGANGEPDPTAGYTGAKVYGYNLTGDYTNSMPEYTLTTTAINCSGAVNTVLSFYRWLGVEAGQYDHARVRISTDAVTWATLWENPTASMSDGEWTQVAYDISEYADGQPTVYVQWAMGTTDSSVVFCGWNIDDVQISYEAPCDAPNLVYESHLADDTAGDADGNMDVGESVVLRVSLENLGVGATNVSAVLATSNPHVTITDNSAYFGDIGQGATVQSQAPHYALVVSAAAIDLEPVTFNLSWTSDQASGTTSFTDHLHAPVLDYASYTVNDSAGDNDGIIDPGEAVFLPVTLSNSGSEAAYNVEATLTVDVPSYVTIDDSMAIFGALAPAMQQQSQAPHFHFSASPSTPDPTTATFTLSITSSNGDTTTASFTAVITTSSFAQRYFFPLDSNPGWVGTNLWAWGVPAGTGGDPSSGYTGANVYGYNLSGQYPNQMSVETLTSEPLNCANLLNTEIRFRRWLGVENATYDHALFQVSADGVNYTTIWENPTSSFLDTSWQAMTYDISAYADQQPQVYLRWVMGPTDYSVTYCGWNLDDIEIWAESAAVTSPTPTVTATSSPVPPTASPTLTPTETPTLTPTSTPTTVPTLTPTTPPTLTPTRTPTVPPTPTMPPTYSSTPTVPLTPTPACLHTGDVNDDGVLTAADAQTAFAITIGAYVPSAIEECAADCNNDGEVTAGDAQRIFWSVMGMDSCVDPLEVAS